MFQPRYPLWRQGLGACPLETLCGDRYLKQVPLDTLCRDRTQRHVILDSLCGNKNLRCVLLDIVSGGRIECVPPSLKELTIQFKKSFPAGSDLRSRFLNLGSVGELQKALSITEKVEDAEDGCENWEVVGQAFL